MPKLNERETATVLAALRMFGTYAGMMSSWFTTKKVTVKEA